MAAKLETASVCVECKRHCKGVGVLLLNDDVGHCAARTISRGERRRNYGPYAGVAPCSRAWGIGSKINRP